MWIYPLIFSFFIIIILEFITRYFSIQDYLLPAPSSILVELLKNYLLLIEHSLVTILEILIGFFLGAIIGFIFAVGMIHIKIFEYTLYPFVMLFQIIPKLAIAPLFLVWLGYGILPKISIVALVSVFPVMVNSFEGMSSVDKRLFDLLGILKASKWQILWKVRFCNALPSIFSGLKVSMSLSILGAIVGEWVGSKSGLGYLILSANEEYNTKLVFATLIILSGIGLIMFAIISICERISIPWHKHIVK